MGGIPRRRACKKCTARRVKCDEAKPFCENCLKRGIVCPGYDTSIFTWRDETTKVQSKAGKSTKDSLEHLSRVCVVNPLNRIESTPLRYNLIVNLHPFANSHVNLSTGSLIWTLDRSVYNNLRPYGFESYLSYIPSRIGRNRALDDAVDCLTALYSNRFCASDFDDRMCRSRYAKALQSLSACLNDKERILEPETLCATLLLGIYEVFDGLGSSSMLKHVHGASQLIRIRGPERHTEPFERAMLIAAQGPLSTESIAKGVESSLDSQTWRDLITNVPWDSILEEDRPCQKIMFMGRLSVPQLLQNCLIALRTVDDGVGKMKEVLADAVRFRKQFIDWARDVLNSNEPAAEGQDRQRISNGDGFSIVIDLFSTALWTCMARCAPLDIGAYGNSYGWLIMINRIILVLTMEISNKSVDSGAVFGLLDVEFDGLESENTQLADLALLTADFIRETQPLGLLYYWFSLKVAQAAQETTNAWSKVVNNWRKESSADLNNGYTNLSLLECFLARVRELEGV